MLDERVILSALLVERRIYVSLSELLETTTELSDALKRQDQVSFQLYLSMRQEFLNQISEYRATLKKQCADLPREEGECLRGILNGTSQESGGQPLADQIRKNRALYDRILQADKLISRRLCGTKSFYQ